VHLRFYKCSTPTLVSVRDILIYVLEFKVLFFPSFLRAAGNTYGVCLCAGLRQHSLLFSDRLVALSLSLTNVSLSFLVLLFLSLRHYAFQNIINGDRGIFHGFGKIRQSFHGFHEFGRGIPKQPTGCQFIQPRSTIEEITL